MARSDFWDAIKNNASITKLITRAMDSIDKSKRDSIASLDRLVALDFVHVGMHDLDEEHISLAPQVTQLTELAISVRGSLLSDLGCLTNLVLLKLRVCLDFDCSLDETLVLLPCLEKVAIQGAGRSFLRFFPVARSKPKTFSLSSRALLESKQLKSLSLDSVAVNEFFFQELSSMAKLTKFEFEKAEEQVCEQSTISQIHRLERLEELKLSLGDQNLMCSFLSPKYLPRLTKLTVRTSEEMEDSLRRRFACRPQILINGAKHSHWRRRPSTMF